VLEQVAHEDVLAALDRVGIDAEQRQEARRRRGDALAQRLRVVGDARGRRGERTSDTERPPARLPGV
jgi:hypothetical protein